MGVLHYWHLSSLGHPEIEEEQGFFSGVFFINRDGEGMAFTVLCCWGRGEEKRMGKRSSSEQDLR